MKKRKFELKKNIGMIISTLLGVITVVVFSVLLFSFELNGEWYEELLFPLYLVITTVVSFVVQIIIHETGHLVFGLLTGYKFSSFRIFSLMLVRESEKFKLKKLSLAGTAGQCLMLPPDIKDDKIPVVLYNLGGSIMNIISGIFFILLGILFSKFSYLYIVFIILALFGFSSALLNGIPMRMGAVNNDGYNAVSLSENREAMKSFWIQLKVVEQTTKGIRIKDMPDDWFIVPNDDAMKNSMVATQGVFACNRLMDAQLFDEADALMKHILEIESGIVTLHRNLLMCDRIYIELINENRREVIEKMLSNELRSFLKSMKNYPNVIRTEYALSLLFEKDINKSKKFENLFYKRAKSYPYPNEIEAERNLMKIAERVHNDGQISKIV